MRTTVPITLEEFGDESLFIELTAVVDVHAGEPTVRYYPDGSGYPGSPPEAELVGILIEEALDIEGLEIDIDEDLELRVEEYLDDNPEHWYEEALEHAEDDYDDV